jgi:predicted amidophosphoribosyltransferase
MMISQSIFPPSRLTKIDQLLIGDHSSLEAEDECYFLGEFTAYKGYQYSPTNQFIFNFKKEPGKNGQHYKQREITRAADAFSVLINPSYLTQSVLVPVPPSKQKSDPGYDDRVVQMLNRMKIPGGKLDVRELVVQKKNLPSAHSGTRLKTSEIEAACTIATSLTKPATTSIGIFDDVIVNGNRFKATQSLLRKKFPGVRTVGFFIARRVPEPDNFENDFTALDL